MRHADVVTLVGPDRIMIEVHRTLSKLSLNFDLGYALSTAETVILPGATVKALAGGAAPTGTVTFFAGTKTLGTVTLSNSNASLPVSSGSLAAGSNSVSATYSGNSSFAESTSTPVAVTIVLPPVATSTVVTASPSVFAQNSSTVLTATVKTATGSGSPAGYVSFVAGGAALGNAMVSSGIAVLTVAAGSLTVGTHNIAANYVSAGNFVGSSSPALTVTVTASPTTPTIIPPTIALSAAPGAGASTTVLTATLKTAGGSAVPTGSVTFSIGTRLLGSAVLSGGSASLTLNNGVFAAGNNSIGVYYPGAAGFRSSTASAVVVVP